MSLLLRWTLVFLLAATFLPQAPARDEPAPILTVDPGDFTQ